MLAGLILAGSAWLVQADQTSPPRPADPTQVDPELQELLNAAGMQNRTGPARMPQIILRARVIAPDRPPVAMVEINGTLHLLGPDTTITIETDQQPLTIDVDVLSATQVHLTIQPLGRKVVLR